ncbi:Fic family protein [Paraperlucidibaca sp.]|uniref:Fic family protein n=1 Tax=Paraperlucidibaca sp. TaxID=2708021 RepID=UPI0030F38E9B
MILFELLNGEEDVAYQSLEVSNSIRHYDFLKSIVTASLEVNRLLLSESVIKALNYHAIACLHVSPGEYRPCQVRVGNHLPPDSYRVPALMDDFVNVVNRHWESEDAVVLASYVLWRMNYIHPFINGNGRTARAACYFILCIKAGGWLPGKTILPELLRRDRDDYVLALRKVDKSWESKAMDISPLHELLSRLLEEQLNDVQRPEADLGPEALS